MPFLPAVKDLVAYRAAYVCSNPDCLRLTAGPSLAGPNLKVKIGEAAHIIGEKSGSARSTFPINGLINDISNAIWLCSSCHTEIDKNNGVDHPPNQLRQWKADIEARIAAILKTHQSPLPLYETTSSNSKIAQNIVDIIGEHGAFFQQYAFESSDAVAESVKRARMKVERQFRLIAGDKRLRSITKALIDACREYMNETSIDASSWIGYLEVLRARTKQQLRLLDKEYGAQISSTGMQLNP